MWQDQWHVNISVGVIQNGSQFLWSRGEVVAELRWMDSFTSQMTRSSVQWMQQWLCVGRAGGHGSHARNGGLKGNVYTEPWELLLPSHQGPPASCTLKDVRRCLPPESRSLREETYRYEQWGRPEKPFIIATLEDPQVIKPCHSQTLRSSSQYHTPEKDCHMEENL